MPLTEPAAPLRILYVEDNLIVREVTTELLAQEQRQIVAMGTAEDALQALEANDFDLLITDVSLPVMSGMDLARNVLKSKPQFAIIIASGYFVDLTLKAWGPNVRSIIKPFDGAAIEALISAVCPGDRYSA
jgi:two-component system, cell cycle response regulator CpdR